MRTLLARCEEKHRLIVVLPADSVYQVSGHGRSVDAVLEYSTGKLTAQTSSDVTRYIVTPSRRRSKESIQVSSAGNTTTRSSSLPGYGYWWCLMMSMTRMCNAVVR
eukprot:scpid91008/ scgid26127/ 